MVSDDTLRKYADVLVHCGCGHGAGITPGDVVVISHNQASIDFIPCLITAIIDAGGHPVLDSRVDFTPGNNLDDLLIRFGNTQQRSHFNYSHIKTHFDSANHIIKLISGVYSGGNPFISQNDLQDKYSDRSKVHKPFTQYISELRKKVPMVLAYVPTQAMADDSAISLDLFWDQVHKGCFLGHDNPVTTMRQSMEHIRSIRDQLNALKIRQLHFEGEYVDLTVAIPPDSPWLGCTGNNMPSFELYTMPCKESTTGSFCHSESFMYQGHIIEGLCAIFKQGKLFEWSVDKGHDAMASLLSIDDGAHFLGEIAITPSLSPLDTVIPTSPLYTENIGNSFHAAFGSSISTTRSKDERYNNMSAVHRDVVHRHPFHVTACLSGGDEIYLFENGAFRIS